MPWFQQLKTTLTIYTAEFLSPKLPDDQLNEALTKSRKHYPLPVLWLIGKTQSGNTSIIEALTGSPRAVIGEGFRACTRHTDVYDFPDETTAFIRFLDTRGLGEAGYDPAADLTYCETQASIVIAVMKAMDHEQDAVREIIGAIHKEHPQWPVIVAQTCLHEGYATRTAEHPLPYPYASPATAVAIPSALDRSLHIQQAAFDDLNAVFVPLDFTHPDEGYEPRYYGLEEFWSAIENALPLGLRYLMEQNREHAKSVYDLYAAEAEPHIIGYAISAGLVALTPIPAVGLPAVLAVQSKMFHSIASIYGLELTARSVGEVLSAVGIGMLSAAYGGRELAKLIPGFGSTVAALSTAAVTYALGKTLCVYYAYTLQGEPFTPAKLKAVYKNELVMGRAALSKRFSNLGKQEPA